MGAIPDSGGVRFSLWAPEKSRATVEVDSRGSFEMAGNGDGEFSVDVAGVAAGSRYWFHLDDGGRLPDLASRRQDADGASVVVSNTFGWTDNAWNGVEGCDEVLYEMHVGTFTAEGTWLAAAARLAWLRDLGVTVLQVMPVGSFGGAFGWGYDTTLPFSPFAPYGTPDDMRAFIDQAHKLGIGVILDVVYNHAGYGDYYSAYSEHFFADRHSEWGRAFNFDGPRSRAVRDFFVQNAVYWIEEFHLDGLRIDAVQELVDSSSEHILAEITRAVRKAAGARQIYMVVENQPQERRMVEPPERGGCGIDAMYNDDFHHAAHVCLTGHSDFYYRDYRGSPQELVSALKHGFLYQGQRSNMRNRPYGTPNLLTAPRHFLHFLENHDQIANSANGSRLGSLSSPARIRAFTTLLLLGPQTPCLFQGEEFGAVTPFLYFLDREGAAAKQVAAGRLEMLSQFQSVRDPAMAARLADPCDPDTFQRSKLDWTQADSNVGVVALHRELIALRRSHLALSQRSGARIDGAVLAEAALALRYSMEQPEHDRLLLANWGRDIVMDVLPEPLLAPPDGHHWVARWSSEHPDFNGAGRVPVDLDEVWILPAESALFFQAVENLS
jgi:maltooligosyltrehalose trehalohydrolase